MQWFDDGAMAERVINVFMLLAKYSSDKTNRLYGCYR